MPPTGSARLRQIAIDLGIGAGIGALLALPLPIATNLARGVSSPLQAAGLGFTRAMLFAVAPGVVIGFGSAGVGVPLNALIWGGSWAVWRSRNPHASAIAAKVITGVCWVGWTVVALLVSVLPTSS